MKKKIIMYPFLFALFPVLFLFFCNIYQVPPYQTFIPIVAVLVFTGLLFLLFRFIFKNSEKTALFVAVFIILFFSFGHICKFGRYSAIYVHGYSILASLVSVLIISAYFIRKADNVQKLSRIFNLMSICLVAFSIANIVYYNVTIRIRPLQQKERSNIKYTIGRAIPIEKLPNIYYIILDGYARSDVLKEIYQHDNGEFIDFLWQKGFYVADKSFTNYCQTVLALPAVLNLTYLNNITNKVRIIPGNAGPLFYLWRRNMLFTFLRKLGYKIVTFDAQGWNEYLRRGDVDILCKTPSIGIMDGFQSELLDMTPIPFIIIRIFKQHDYRYAFLRKRILYAFDNLEKISKKRGPYFIFAHILTPHQPFLFGKNGEFITPKMDRYTEWFPITAGRDRGEYVRKYRNQLIYVNKKVQQVIDKILSNSPTPPIIILQADHGPCANLDPESAKNTDHKERMGILNAYYFPDKDYSALYETITPVNSFRVILNRYFGTKFKLLEDRSYFSSWSKTYDFTEVTNEINFNGTTKR